MPVSSTSYSWTKNADHSNLTGKARKVEHKYFGYKIIVNENGEFEAIKSPLVSNIIYLPKGYIYVKEDFTEIVYTYINEYTDEKKFDSETDSKIDYDSVQKKLEKN